MVSGAVEVGEETLAQLASLDMRGLVVVGSGHKVLAEIGRSVGTAGAHNGALDVSRGNRPGVHSATRSEEEEKEREEKHLAECVLWQW